MEYLIELRRRLLYCSFYTFLVFLVLCFFANPLYQGLTHPLLLQLPEAYLIATSITAPFLVPLKFVFLVSIFILMPFFLYHFWSFIAPALYHHERKTLWVLLVPSVLLFYLGMLFCYFIVLPCVFRFFVATTPSHVKLLPDIGQYLSFTLQTLFSFGIGFQVPIVVLALTKFHIMSIAQLESGRRYVIVLAFIVGMLLTPPDVLSQILLALPMWFLFELGLVLAKILAKHDKGL